MMVKKVPVTHYEYHAEVPVLMLSYRIGIENFDLEMVYDLEDNVIKPDDKLENGVSENLHWLIDLIFDEEHNIRTDFHNGDDLALTIIFKKPNRNPNYDLIEKRQLQLCELIMNNLAKYERNQEYEKTINLSMDDIRKMDTDEKAAS